MLFITGFNIDKMPCKDKQKQKAYDKKYRLKNKEKRNAYDRKFRKENPEYFVKWNKIK